MPEPAGLAVAFVLLLALFRGLELTRPREQRLSIFRSGFWTDLAYWAFTPLVTRVATRIALLIVIVPLGFMLYGRLERDELLSGWGPLSRLPISIQAALMLVAADFIGYWMHRGFHGRRLWPFHAVHHSSVDLDWLSSVRLHPVNDAVMRIAAAVPLLVAGFTPTALVAITPLLTLLAILVHANVDWDWGPLRSIVVSPCFHRWHHTDESEARDKNFSGLFPVWDILFGTYYMPKSRSPARFGTATPVPSGLLSQLAFPFRRSEGIQSADNAPK